MAAFSYSHHPFLLDSVFLPNTPIMMSGFMEDANLNTNNCFSQFYPTSQHETSCVLDRSSKVALSDNERSMTKKQSNTESSSVVDKLESGEQVTQKLPIMEKKRRSRNGSSLSSAVSKEPRENKGKKQKKCNDAQKDEGKKLKFDKNSQAKAEEEPASRDYIHVRARRGQATDSHSLAERVRREKISERMKMLQKLVPGCDKVTGKALMLDEIINYVQSLQNQVEFLSMKLASVNPMFYDFGMDLDSFMGRPERLSSMALPIPSVPQCGPTQPTAFADTLPAASFTTATNYPPMENSAAPLLLQHEQSSNAFCHVHDSDFTMDNGNLLWDMEDQKLNFLNPSGFSNNLCSFN